MCTARKFPAELALVLLFTGLHGCQTERAQSGAASVLVAAAPGDDYNTGPGSELGIYPVNANIYETLVRLTPDYRVAPMLATRWEFRPPNTWRFHLRQGVKMHDGTAFTARSVEWTIRRMAKTERRLLGTADSSVRVLDDSTVDITPTRPNLRLLEQLVHPNWSIIAHGSEPSTAPVGTGPFKIVEYAKGNRLTVERFAGYWGEKARLNRITFRFITDPNTRVLALRSGEVGIAYDLPREEARDVARVPGLTLASSQVGSYEALYVTIHGDPPYDLGRDRSIRRALAYAIDKQAIVESVWQGNAERGQTLVPASILGESARLVRGTAFDPASAKQILDSAGWMPGPDGVRARRARRLSLTMIVGFPNPEIHRPMPEVVQAQLRAIGVELKIVQTADNASYQARIRSGQGDLWAEAGGQNDANPCFLPDLLFYRGGAPADRSSYARIFGPGAGFDRFIDACRSAGNAEAARRNAAEAMRVLVDEEFVVIPLAATYRLWGVSNRVRGFVPHPSSLSQRWESVWLAAAGSG